jgi:NitT/TauT family transport system substrate-binding protein
VVNAQVKAQLWIRGHRAETAALLSKDGVNKYTPHATAVLEKVLSPPDGDNAGYLKSGAIRNAEWRERRIDFQPYPFPSYTEELVRRLKQTLIEGDRGFLDALDPAAAANDLVDDRFVKAAVTAAGGLAAFGLPDSFTRTEVVTA